jgi:FKBP-type peptidyl-prolyl cis-trans isomerase SlyD
LVFHSENQNLQYGTNLMEVGKDTFVIIDYRIRLDDGSFVKGENGPVSLNFIVGYDQVLLGLERSLLGLREGTAVEFIVPASEAFGEHDASQVHTKTFEEFPEGHSLQAGKWVVATNEQTQAQYSYYVQGKTEDAVTLDFNHPLAGKDLHYQVKVISVRPALKEELEYLRPCEHQDDSPPVG